MCLKVNFAPQPEYGFIFVAAKTIFGVKVGILGAQCIVFGKLFDGGKVDFRAIVIKFAGRVFRLVLMISSQQFCAIDFGADDYVGVFYAGCLTAINAGDAGCQENIGIALKGMQGGKWCNKTLALSDIAFKRFQAGFEDNRGSVFQAGFKTDRAFEKGVIQRAKVSGIFIVVL